jgi:hypothetical protein
MPLMAWDPAFVPGPSPRRMPSEIYRGYRWGRHVLTGGTAKLIAVASMLLFLAPYVVGT